jgi:ATP-dependent HslUV protease, peptidase subunit HslV
MTYNIKATTIVCVQCKGVTAIAGDGQVTFGDTVIKHGATKIRRLYNDEVIVGFAGTAADAFALLECFETKLDEYKGNLQRSAVELAKDWRTDRMLRRLEAMIIAADAAEAYVISGSGDVISPEGGVLAIGSGGPYVQAAAQALLENTDLDAETIVRKAMKIASGICIYTNENIMVETIGPEEEEKDNK